ncbi:hypothetical protein AAH994_06060 [Weeksellaceae bacterium A-14]
MKKRFIIKANGGGQYQIFDNESGLFIGPEKPDHWNLLVVMIWLNNVNENENIKIWI